MRSDSETALAPGTHDLRSGSRGFTLLELLITLLLFSFLVAGVWSVFQSQSRGLAIQDQVVEVHNNLRVGVWDMGLDLMHAGLGRVYTLDPGDGTTCRDLGVLDANPWQVTFLYDVNDSDSTGGAVDGPAFTWDNGNGSLANQLCPTDSCATGCALTVNGTTAGDPQLHAEVVRLTLDSEDASTLGITGPVGTAADGSTRTLGFSLANSRVWMANINQAADGDAASINPADYLLRKEVISRNAAGTFFEPLAYGVRGHSGTASPAFTAPVNELGNSFAMFTYFLDTNFDGLWQCASGSGPDALKGDSNGDCALSDAEIAVLMNPNSGALSPLELMQVLRIGVELRAETQRADPLYTENGGFRFRVLRTSFRLNNMAFPP